MKKVFIIISITLILSALGGLLYFLFFSNKEQEQPTTMSVEGVLLIHQTKSENIITDTETEIRFVNNELLLTVNEDVTQEDVESFLAVQGGEIVGYDTFLHKYQILLKSEYTLSELETVRAEFAYSDLFTNVRVNLAFEIETNSFTPNDSELKNEWNKADGKAWGAIAIHAPEMWYAVDAIARPPVNIGIYDSQFYTEHEDLNFADTFYNKFDSKSDNHGSHVAGTIAATFNNRKGVAGILPNANLYGVSVNGISNRNVKQNIKMVTISAMEAGLTYLICIKECKIVNLSWGVLEEHQVSASNGNRAVINDIRSGSAELEEALLMYAEFYDLDFLIVKAAGNTGHLGGKAQYDWLSDITEPILKDRIIVVGNAERNNGSIGVNSRSSYGSRVDLIAPGSRIFSTVYKKRTFFFPSNNGYDYMSGTSMATPHVSGVAAVMWSVNPNLTGADIKRIIVETATGSYGYENTSIKDKYKMLDGYEAVKAAADYVTQPREEKNDKTLPFDEPITVGFAFGAKGWGTQININPDGTFTGTSRNSEYNPEIEDIESWRCVFSGKFTNIRKISNYEYSMWVRELKVEGVSGEKRVDGTFVMASPYCVEEGDRFLLYLPGRITADLPQEYIETVKIDGIRSERPIWRIPPAVLPFYGLKNVSDWGDFDSQYVVMPSNPNLIDTMEKEEYRRLNQFFMTFSEYYITGLRRIKSEMDMLSFAAWWLSDGMGEYDIPQKEIEKLFSRYFGVKKINHESVAFTTEWYDETTRTLLPSYKNGYYRSALGRGGEPLWTNVSELFDNGDGTMTAKVSVYSYPRLDSPPKNQYDRVHEWELHDGQRVIDYYEHDDDNHIVKQSEDIVVIRPYTENGEKTWQIISINGWDIPTELFT